MSHLTQAQIAALQQMGICVWMSADKLATAKSASSESGERSPSLGSVSASSDNTVSVDRVAQLRESLTKSTPQASQDKPVPMPLTEAQRVQHARIISDLNQAWALCYPKESPPELVVGQSLRVTGSTIELPCEPGQLDAGQKASLWNKLWQA